VSSFSFTGVVLQELMSKRRSVRQSKSSKNCHLKTVFFALNCLGCLIFVLNECRNASRDICTVPYKYNVPYLERFVKQYTQNAAISIKDT
jgi:hypothetical protein